MNHWKIEKYDQRKPKTIKYYNAKKQPKRHEIEDTNNYGTGQFSIWIHWSPDSGRQYVAQEVYEKFKDRDEHENKCNWNARV